MGKKKYAVFTMDVERFSDTECIANSKTKVDVDLLDGLDEYIELLDKYDIKSTLFTVGDLAEQIKDKLDVYLDNGHQLALHNYTHTAPMSLTKEEFSQGVKSSKEHLEKLFGKEIVGFRAPCFSMDNDRIDILKNLGFKYDSSYLGFSKARHTVKLNFKNYNKIHKNVYKDKDFFEFGISRQKIFGKQYPISGGGYVRLFNWGVIKSVIKHYLRQNDYYVFYLHPFELSKQKVPVLKELKSYDKYYLKNGMSGYKRHIEQLIKILKKFGYSFVTFEELSEKLSQKKKD